LKDFKKKILKTNSQDDIAELSTEPKIFRYFNRNYTAGRGLQHNAIKFRRHSHRSTKRSFVVASADKAALCTPQPSWQWFTTGWGLSFFLGIFGSVFKNPIFPKNRIS